MELTFNIIFVRDTVRYLRLAVLSLLAHSPYRYRLIANGLKRDELAVLEEFCGLSARLELYAYPTVATVPHGTLLTLLAAREQGEYFCFMDPDIFASAPFQEELEAQLAECDIFSSCYHLGLDVRERLVGFQGRCLETPTGLPLATTFFSVYRNEPLRRLTQESGVGFERCSYAQHYGAGVQEALARLGLAGVRRCDTGKLLNLVAHSYKLRFNYRELAGLTHIGGVADCLMNPSWRASVRDNVGRLLRGRHVLADSDLEPRWRPLRKLRLAWTGEASASDDAAEIAAIRGRLRRRQVAVFFSFFLQSLFDGTPEPVLAISDRPLAERIVRLCSVIRELYGEHYHRFHAAA